MATGLQQLAALARDSADASIRPKIARRGGKDRHPKGFRATLSQRDAQLLERFASEAPIVTACVRYIHGWVMRKFECDDAATLAFTHKFVAQAILYGVVAIDTQQIPPRVVPIPAVEIEVERDTETDQLSLHAYLRHSELVAGGTTQNPDRPLELHCYETPDLDRLRFNSPLASITSDHAYVKVGRFLQTQIMYRNATRANFFMQAEGVDPMVRQRMAGLEAVSQAVWGENEALRMETDAVGAMYTSIHELQSAVTQRAKSQMDAQARHMQSQFDLMQCTAANENVPRFADANQLLPLDPGTTLAQVPTTPFAPGLEAFQDRYERQVCACLGLTLENVQGDPVQAPNPQVEQIILLMSALLRGASTPAPLNSRRADVEVVKIQTPKDLIEAAKIGLLSYEEVRERFGAKRNAGIPTPSIDQLPGMRSSSTKPSAKSATEVPPAKMPKRGAAGPTDSKVTPQP